MEFVQVDLRTNLDSSLALGDRSRAADVVIRLLRGEIAGYSFSLYSEEKRRVTIWMQMKRYDWRSWMARYGLR